MAQIADVSTKEHICNAAYRLFLQRGYNATSFADIAEFAGVSKSLVQKHFGKKEAFIYAFLSDLLNYTDEYLSAHNLKTDNYWVNLYRIGVLHYEFLLRDEGRRKLMVDLMSDRRLTDTMIDLDIAWAFDYLHGFSEEQSEELRESILVTMAGVYELIYRSLVNEVPLDFDNLQHRAVALTMFLQGIPQQEAEKLLSTGQLSAIESDEALAYLDKCFDIPDAAE